MNVNLIGILCNQTIFIHEFLIFKLSNISKMYYDITSKISSAQNCCFYSFQSYFCNALKSNKGVSQGDVSKDEQTTYNLLSYQ